jgi:hypothetical protein
MGEKIPSFDFFELGDMVISRLIAIRKSIELQEDKEPSEDTRSICEGCLMYIQIMFAIRKGIILASRDVTLALFEEIMDFCSEAEEMLGIGV